MEPREEVSGRRTDVDGDSASCWLVGPSTTGWSLRQATGCHSQPFYSTNENVTGLLVTRRPTDLILTDSLLHNLSLLFLHLETIYLEQNYINKREKKHRKYKTGQNVYKCNFVECTIPFSPWYFFRHIWTGSYIALFYLIWALKVCQGHSVIITHIIQNTVLESNAVLYLITIRYITFMSLSKMTWKTLCLIINI